jgi:hypothetical protein
VGIGCADVPGTIKPSDRATVTTGRIEDGFISADPPLSPGVDGIADGPTTTEARPGLPG